MSVKSINPAINRVIKSYESLTLCEALGAVGKAHEAFDLWRGTSFDEEKKRVPGTIVIR